MSEGARKAPIQTHMAQGYKLCETEKRCRAVPLAHAGVVIMPPGVAARPARQRIEELQAQQANSALGKRTAWAQHRGSLAAVRAAAGMACQLPGCLAGGRAADQGGAAADDGYEEHDLYKDPAEQKAVVSKKPPWTRQNTVKHGSGSFEAARRPAKRNSVECAPRRIPHRGSIDATGRRAHISKAAVLAVANQVETGRLTTGDGGGKARLATVRNSQRQMFSTATTKRVPKTFRDTMKINGVREAVLSDARKLSPISAVMYASKLRLSVLPRLLAYPIVWVVVLIYAASATLARTRDLYLDAVGSDPFGGASHGHARCAHRHARALRPRTHLRSRTS